MTGAAGFVGSHLVEALLRAGQSVRGLDDYSTGRRTNLEDVAHSVGADTWERLRMLEGSVESPAACAEACAGVDGVLHQAALGSVPRSIEHPLDCHRANVTGFVTLLQACIEAHVPRFVYASSSSVYGDHPGLPKHEDDTGAPLSPYAATKKIGELYARVHQTTYGIETVGLRYFNVFGPRQDPDGPYAAVVPRWILRLLSGAPVRVFGDGETSRDFTPVANVVAANLAAALCESAATGAAYNVALGERTTLNELFRALRDGLARRGRARGDERPEYADFRPGDVRHSLADLTRARERLGYRPAVGFAAGLEATLDWFVARADSA